MVVLWLAGVLLLLSCASPPNSSALGKPSSTTLDEPQVTEVPLGTPQPEATVQDLGGDALATSEPPAVVYRQSPIDAVMGLVEVDAADYATYRTQLDLDRYNDASLCMRQIGFDVPLGWAPQQYGPAVPRTDSDLLREVGYGVAYGLQFGIDNESTTATSDHAAWVAGMKAEWEEFRDSASDSEFEAFAAARNECMSAMAEKLPDIYYPERSVEVHELVASARQAIHESTEMSAIWAEWSACMAEQGYQVAGRDDFFRELTPLVQEASLELHTNQEPFSDEQLAEFQRLADEVRALELAIAEDDIACSNLVQLDQRTADVRFQMEVAFVEEHGDRITALIGEQ